MKVLTTPKTHPGSTLARKKLEEALGLPASTKKSVQLKDSSSPTDPFQLPGRIGLRNFQIFQPKQNSPGASIKAGESTFEDMPDPWLKPIKALGKATEKIISQLKLG